MITVRLLKTAAIGILILSAISGCGTQTVEEMDGAEDRPRSISFMTNVGLKPDEGFQSWIQEYTRQTGIELDFTYTNTNDYYSNLKLRAAVGNEPDVFAVGGDRLSVYALNGKLFDMTELVKNSQVIQHIEPEFIDSITLDGRIYGIPLERGGGTVTYIRKDWLDELGLQAPTNYDEFINVLREFKKYDKDIIPFTAAGFVTEQAEYYLSQFYQDATPEFTLNADGKWVDGMLEPNMVPALIRMREAYSEGLIDSEIITNKTSTCRNKWYEGKVGVFNYWTGNWAVSLEDRLKENVETAQVEPILPIKECSYIERIPSVLCISATCPNPEEVFRHFIEYAADGTEGSMLFQHGVKDVHYKIDDDGKVIPKEKQKAEEKYEKAFISPVLTTTPIQTEGYEFPLDERITKSLEIFYNNYEEALIIPASEKLCEVNEELVQLREKTISDIVYGQTSIEEGLKYYKEQAQTLGMAEIISELNSNKG